MIRSVPRAERAEPGHRERRVAAVVPPRLQVVADEHRVEAALLGEHAVVAAARVGANCSFDAL